MYITNQPEFEAEKPALVAREYRTMLLRAALVWSAMAVLACIVNVDRREQPQKLRIR